MICKNFDVKMQFSADSFFSKGREYGYFILGINAIYGQKGYYYSIFK